VSGALPKNVVHVWQIPVEALAGRAPNLGDLLTPIEHARASRFTRDEDRCRFQLGRAATRCILARYLELPPAEVRIELDPLGKPQLSTSGLPIDRLIHFNLSHSGSWVLAAFARSFAVGIDVEPLRPETVTADLIEYFMSDIERRILHTLPLHQQTAAFFKCWTSKEALLKGLGLGLAVPLQTITVSVDPGQPAQLLAAPPELCAGHWHLRTLELAAHYAATLALAADGVQIVDIPVTRWRDFCSV
jgi:4'-phosphopantetheinyl transferase